MDQIAIRNCPIHVGIGTYGIRNAYAGKPNPTLLNTLKIKDDSTKILIDGHFRVPFWCSILSLLRVDQIYNLILTCKCTSNFRSTAILRVKMSESENNEFKVKSWYWNLECWEWNNKWYSNVPLTRIFSNNFCYPWILCKLKKKFRVEP